MNPILCRLPSYFDPGFPSPTNRRMARAVFSYFFLSPPAAGALAAPAAGALAAPAAGAAAPAAGAAAPAAGAPASAVGLASSPMPDGDTMVTSVTSSRDTGFTPLGSSTVLKCSELLISSLETSTS